MSKNTPQSIFYLRTLKLASANFEMTCDGDISWLRVLVVFLYVLASSVSFVTILLYKYPQVCHSIPVLRTIFLFGKCAPTNYGKSALLQVPKRFFAHFYVTAAIVSLLTIFVALNSHCKFLWNGFIRSWLFCDDFTIQVLGLPRTLLFWQYFVMR